MPGDDDARLLRQYDLDMMLREHGTFSLRALHVLLNVGGPEQGEPFSAAVLKSLERRLFAEYDADRSGGLDREELERLLRDLYQVALVEAEQQDASAAWVARARSQLDSEYGQATLLAAVEQLLALRDANANGSLELSEVQAVLRTEILNSAFHRGRFWRLAPLCDVPIDMDRLTNGPNIKGKIFLAGAVSGIIAKSGCSPLSRITILLQTGGIGPNIKGTSSTLGLARHIFKSEGLVSQRHPAHCFSAVLRPFCAVFSPFLCAVRLPGAETERTGEKWRKMGEIWGRNGR
eukprot:COSAG04_NODE_7959_length_1041_cov_1.615711_1_plen_290_part_01